METRRDLKKKVLLLLLDVMATAVRIQALSLNNIRRGAGGRGSSSHHSSLTTGRRRSKALVSCLLEDDFADRRHPWRCFATDFETIKTGAQGRQYQQRLPSIRLYSSSSSTNENPQELSPYLSSVQKSLFEDIFPAIIAHNNHHTNANHKEESYDENDDEVTVVVLVGVSGGCDSMGLIHALLDLSSPKNKTANKRHPRQFEHHPSMILYQAEIHVVHFDHCQRGEESKMDCQLVEEFCKDNQLPFHLYTWDNDNVTTDDHRDTSTAAFTQERARHWRQSTMIQLLEELAPHQTTAVATTGRRVGAILTAHHADDSQETLLLKFIRGVHVTNLSGMEPMQVIERKGVQSLWVRPLLHVSKSAIQDYLISQDYSWREDVSNQSNKYLRNRVRNELIPLLQDMVGGEESLQNRLERLGEQSAELRHYLAPQVKAYLEHHVDASTGQFLLPDSSMDLVAREALYQWIADAMASKNQISYDVMKHVRSQINEYPNRRRWTLELGKGNFLLRKGDALEIEHQSQQLQTMNSPEKEDNDTKEVSWISTFKANPIISEAARSEYLVIKVDEQSMDGSSFFKTTAGQNHNRWKFTPSWRKGHSPTKLGSFLRGQKIPLHKRDATPIIYFKSSSSESCSLVAVFVDDKWIVDANWEADEQSQEAVGDSPSVVLDLSAYGKGTV